MSNYKNKIAKIIFSVILILVLIFNIITTKSYSATVNVATDSNIINDNLEFNYKLNFDETMLTTDFILEFDTKYIEFLGVDTENTEYNQLEDGKIIFVYVDEEGNGTKDVNINFKVKADNFDDSTKAEIKVTDINSYSLNKGEAYITKDYDLEKTVMFLEKYVEDNNTSNDKNDDNQNDDNQNDSNRDDEKQDDSTIGEVNNNQDDNNNNIEDNEPNSDGTNDNIQNNTNNDSQTNDEINQEFSSDTNVNTDNVGAVDNKNNSSTNDNNNNNDRNIEISTPEPTEEKAGSIPFTGKTSSTVATILLVILIVHTIYMFFKTHNKQTNFYIAFALGLILFGTLDSNAVGNIFIKNYDRIKNFENLIVIMPDSENRNISKSDFISIQNSNDLKIVKVIDKDADIVGSDALISTGNTAYSNKKVNYKVLVYGDVNCDGNVNSNDIAEIIVNKINGVEIAGLVRKAANVFNENDLEDKNIDSNDIKVIKQYTLRTLTGNLVNSLPEELVRSISIVPEKTEMDVGEEQQLSINIEPNNMSVDDIEWTSNNEEILTVDTTGKVTAKSSGTAYITAMSKSDSVLNDTISITVNDVVTGVKLHIKKIELEVGETRHLGATVEPPTAKNKNVLWSTSNAKIVSVDVNGKITAVDEGTATIKVTTEEGRFTDVCEVTVLEEDIIKPDLNTQVTGIVISKTTTTLSKGQTEQLDAFVLPATALFQSVSWKSSNTDIVTVDQKGKIKAISSGIAVITVTSDDGGYTASCVVTVDKVDVTDVTLNKTTLKMDKGEKETLIANVRPNDATNKEVVWSTSNSLVATVENGVVTAKGAGIATISAKTKDGGHIAICTVQVNPTRVTGIELNREDVVVYVDNTVKVTAIVYPANADNKDVIWESSNEDIFIVDDFGNITGVSKGTAKLSVRTVDGNFRANCDVKVLEEERNVESVSLNRSKISIKEGESELLIATIQPENATNKNVTWTSSNIDVAEVDNYGRVLAKKEGLSVITVKTQDGYKTAKCEVTVTKKIIRVTGIVLNKNTVTLDENQSETLIATIQPENADNKDVKWTSLNTRIAEVDSNGKITAKAPGKTTIVVTTEDGNKTATCDVMVNKVVKPVSEIRLNKNSITLEKNQKERLLVTIEPVDADNKNVTWTTSNTAVATVDENGEITARGTGNAIITVTTEDGNKTATCTVTVTAPIIQPEISVQLSTNNIELEVGQKTELSIIVTPEDTLGERTWNIESYNSSVIGVEKTDNWSIIEVEGRNQGTVELKIKVTIAGKEFNLNCNVSVKKVIEEPPTPEISVTLNKENMELEIGEMSELSVVVNPPNTYETRYFCNNRDIIDFREENDKFYVIGKSAGTTEIEVTVIINEVEYKLKCSVLVKGNGSEVPDEVNVSIDKTKLELNIGESSDITINVTPPKNMEYEVSYTNSSIAKIETNSNIVKVTGLKSGTTKLKFKVLVNEKEYNFECDVIVNGISKLNFLKRLLGFK